MYEFIYLSAVDDEGAPPASADEEVHAPTHIRTHACACVYPVACMQANLAQAEA